MLIHEFSFLSPFALTTGWDELYEIDNVTGTNYQFYGLAQWDSGAQSASQNAAKWWIYATRLNADGTAAASRYYPPNQTWANRLSLSLP